jgi:hypothetical protein
MSILSRFMCDYRRGLDWWMDLLATSTHDSELQAVTTLSPISTLYKSLPAKSSPAGSVFTSRFLVTALNSSLQLLCSRRYCPANILQVTVNLIISAISSQPPLQNSADLLLQLSWLYNFSAWTT